MKQRVRKAHAKSRNGCVECKKRHHKCDECYPVCGQCHRIGTTCSLSQPSPAPNPSLEDRTLNIDDLRLLHHWHNASEQEDFAPFVDHARTDGRKQHNRVIELSFKHPYVLHSLLALSALHLLHGTGTADSKLYHLASAHSISGMRLVRPQVARGDAEHRDAVFNFAAFSSLYAMAEPPLRAGDAAMTTPIASITAILDAFKMCKGVRAVQDPFVEELKSSGAFDPTLWKDNSADIIPTLETDYPQLSVLKRLITEHCSKRERQPCLDAVQLIFTAVGVFASNHKNHSSLRLIQTWPMDIDSICLEIFEANHPVGLVILAHYGALMSLRSHYWFFARWPSLLLDSVTSLLQTDWHGYLEWPREVILKQQQYSNKAT